MTKDVKDFETIDLFSWMEQQMTSPEGRRNAEAFVLRKLRLDNTAANDRPEWQIIIDKINDLFIRADNENKVTAIGTEAIADKACRIVRLQNELVLYKSQLTDWVSRELK